jgi:hypothetical protein
MGYTFRTDGAWGLGVGRDLFPAEVDGNFWQAIQDVAAKAAQGVGISNFVVNGNQFTVVLTDHTLLGPYALPMMQIIFRGEWLPNQYYSAGSVITHGGNTYFVNVNHTSAATFDPGANDGHGNDYYGLLLQNPALTLPTGGAIGTFLRKSGLGDYVSNWESASLGDLSDVFLPVSPGPTAGDVLTYGGGTWSNQAILFPSIPSVLNDLTDVVTSGLQLNQALMWSGTEWVNQYVPFANLQGLTISSPAAGDTIVYDGNIAQFKNVPSINPPVWTINPTSGNIVVDLSKSPFTSITFGGNTAITSFTWPTDPSNYYVRRVLRISNQGNYTVTWPTNIRWPGGVIPTVTVSGIDTYIFHSINGGSTLYGNVVGQNYL